MGFLKNQLLISMPHMQDPIFSKSVIYICDHNAEGAMGLIINKKIKYLDNNPLFENISINKNHSPLLNDLFLGGPVLLENGIILHHARYKAKDALSISKTISITNKQNALKDLQYKKTIPFKLMLGHCGWAPHQLEKEIENGDWIMQHTTDDFIFNIPPDQLWEQATNSIGIDMGTFIGSSGKT